MALSAGQIAFVGFNADGSDNIAFVALADIAAGESLVFEDNEWNGSGWTDTNEGAIRWTATSAVPAGTVVTIDRIGDAANTTASTGTVASEAGRGGNRGLAASDETLFVYQGAAAAPVFITAVASGGFSAGNGTLAGTGLAAGATALNLSALDDDLDVAAYVGPRSGQVSLAAYAALVNTPSNWVAEDGSGDQSANGVSPDVPFDTTAFTASGTAAGVRVTPAATPLPLAEGGASGTYTVVLTRAPGGDVTVAIASDGQTQASTAQLVFSPADWNLPQQVTVTAVDDTLVEGQHASSVTHSVSSADPAYDGIGAASVAVSITDNDTPAVPTVGLSVSRSTASEADGSWVTVTVTASAAVATAQTVALDIGGSGIDGGDYLVDSTTLTIPAGQTQATVRLVVLDDALDEPTETLQLSLSSPSSGLVLGTATDAGITVTDHDASLLTKVGGASSANGAEIAAFDPASDRLYVVAGPVVEVYTMGSTGALALAATVAPGFTPAPGASALPNSVAVKGGIAAVAWAQVQGGSHAQLAGHVSLYDAASGALLSDVEVGHLPDMLSFTPDGRRIVVANEGEPNSYGQADSVDPEGSVSIIDLAGGAAGASARTADFLAFNDQLDALRAAGVRIFGPGASVAQDLEPEYVAIGADGSTALVTLQENNAIAVVDLDSATVTAILPLGTQDHAASGSGLDPSDRDGASNGGINIANWPVQGMYMPDAIASFAFGGQTYHITANEGDARDYPGFSEELRVGSGSYTLDPTLFPDAAALKNSAALGRLTVSTASGDADGDGDFEQIMSFGSRSVSIWSDSGARVWDSGDALERITALRTPQLFNSDGLQSSFDGRSDNKGPEPEGLVVGTLGARLYAFVGLERSGDIAVFDIGNPAAPQFVQLINRPEDQGVEGLSFITAADSPTGRPLLVTSNEVSRTIAVFEIEAPVRIADIQGAAHRSPLLGQAVQQVPGKVTVLASNGFYLQDPAPDTDPATSDAVFVYTGAAPTVAVGDAVKVSGTVSEFRPGNAPTNLSVTQIGHNAAVQPLLVMPWADAPADAIRPLVLGVDRIAPTTRINDDGSVNVETGGDFEPGVDGIDFYESLEGMLLRVDAPQVVSPTNAFGEIWVLPQAGAGATGVNARGGITIADSDLNPERLQLDNLVSSQVFPQVDVGARLDAVTGVVDFAFGNYELRTLTAPSVAQAPTLPRESTSLVGTPELLTVATFNVENLDPSDGDARFEALAAAIVGKLASPDILSLEEVQDNSGAVDDGVVAADATLRRLVDAIADAGGPSYAYRQIDPADNASGGEPGGNIRVAFLFRTDRVAFVDGSLRNLTDTDLSDGDAFAHSRRPLVGDFVFNGESITLVANHFNSKSGDQPLYGPQQPPLRPSDAQRLQQADSVADYVAGRLAADPDAQLLVLGDLNDFPFSAPLTRLEDSGLNSLVETLPAAERYTYVFDGNAQALDHVLASTAMTGRLDGFDVVHLNAEFADQVSDHDPLVARFGFALPRSLAGTAGRDLLLGGDGPDRIAGNGGRDLIAGGKGADTFVFADLADLTDLITDFEAGRDRLDLDPLMSAVGAAGQHPVTGGYLSAAGLAVPLPGGSPVPLATVVLFDADGLAGPDLARPLVVLAGVVVADAHDLLGP